MSGIHVSYKVWVVAKHNWIILKNESCLFQKEPTINMDQKLNGFKLLKQKIEQFWYVLQEQSTNKHKTWIT